MTLICTWGFQTILILFCGFQKAINCPITIKKYDSKPQLFSAPPNLAAKKLILMIDWLKVDEKGRKKDLKDTLHACFNNGQKCEKRQKMDVKWT